MNIWCHSGRFFLSKATLKQSSAGVDPTLHPDRFSPSAPCLESIAARVLIPESRLLRLTSCTVADLDPARRPEQITFSALCLKRFAARVLGPKSKLFYWSHSRYRRG